MGIDIEQYRCRIGTFGHSRDPYIFGPDPVQCLGRETFIMMMLLLLMAGIEPNPGPGPQDPEAEKMADSTSNSNEVGRLLALKNNIVKLKSFFQPELSYWSFFLN